MTQLKKLIEYCKEHPEGILGVIATGDEDCWPVMDKSVSNFFALLDLLTDHLELDYHRYGLDFSIEESLDYQLNNIERQDGDPPPYIAWQPGSWKAELS